MYILQILNCNENCDAMTLEIKYNKKLISFKIFYFKTF